MVKTRAIQVRLTIRQHERLKQQAEAQGFASVSAWVRHAALDPDVLLHQRVAEIHRFLLGDEKRGKRRTLPAHGP